MAAHGKPLRNPKVRDPGSLVQQLHQLPAQRAVAIAVLHRYLHSRRPECSRSEYIEACPEWAAGRIEGGRRDRRRAL